MKFRIVDLFLLTAAGAVLMSAWRLSPVAGVAATVCVVTLLTVLFRSRQNSIGLRALGCGTAIISYWASAVGSAFFTFVQQRPLNLASVDDFLFLVDGPIMVLGGLTSSIIIGFAGLMVGHWFSLLRDCMAD